MNKLTFHGKFNWMKDNTTAEEVALIKRLEDIEKIKSDKYYELFSAQILSVCCFCNKEGVYTWSNRFCSSRCERNHYIAIHGGELEHD